MNAALPHYVWRYHRRVHRHPRFTLVRLVLPVWPNRARFYYDGREYSCGMVEQGWSIEDASGGTAVAVVVREESAWAVTSLSSGCEHRDSILFLAVAAALDNIYPEMLVIDS